MSKEEKGGTNSVYWSIVQGSLKTPVPETHPEAEVRHWEAGGNKGTKIERSIKAIFGKITGVSFFDSESGGKKFSNINIRLDENEDGKTPVISTGVSTRYAQDILKKLPNVDFSQEVRIRPYAFVPEGEEKTVTGVEITQQDKEGNFTKKITNFFSEQVAPKKSGEVAKWVAVNGYPEPTADEKEDDDWEGFYKRARKFLVNYTKAHIVPKFTDNPAQKEDEQFAAHKEAEEKIEPPSILKKHKRNKQEIEEGIDISEQAF